MLCFLTTLLFFVDCYYYKNIIKVRALSKVLRVYARENNKRIYFIGEKFLCMEENAFNSMDNVMIDGHIQ